MSAFLEVDYCQENKQSMMICGDVFLRKRQEERERVLMSLSDGLGSGVKANVLASMTATMIRKYMENDVSVEQAAENVMRTLPVCAVRKISYSTFTMVEIGPDAEARIMEYDNPAYLFLRGGTVCPQKKEPIFLDQRFAGKRDMVLSSSVGLREGDRLVLCTDGVTQAGMGTRRFPFGWGEDGLSEFVTGVIASEPGISASLLSRRIVREALSIDGGRAKDDITCAVIYARKPRKLLVVTGPPIDKANDRIMGEKLESFEGRKIIAGGTTAAIIAGHLQKQIHMNISSASPTIPPWSMLEGVDLVSEGIITLSYAAEYLEKQSIPPRERGNAAALMARQMLESDHVSFLVGNKINEAHQDPSMPVEIAIRRTIVKRIKAALENTYLKTVEIEYL